MWQSKYLICSHKHTTPLHVVCILWMARYLLRKDVVVEHWSTQIRDRSRESASNEQAPNSRLSPALPQPCATNRSTLIVFRYTRHNVPRRIYTPSISIRPRRYTFSVTQPSHPYRPASKPSQATGKPTSAIRQDVGHVRRAIWMLDIG